MKNAYEIRGDVTVIFIKHKGRALKTIIDTVDLQRAQEFTGTWYGWRCPKTGGIYVCGMKTINGHRTSFRLHRWISNVPDHLQIDHINHNPLNNRRSVNLRIVTNAQNCQNRKGPLRNNRSGYLNVHFDNERKKWVASLILNGRKVLFKRFDSKSKAINEAKCKRSKLMPFSEVKP